MIDPSPLWDFDDPAASEQRFREAAAGALGGDRLMLLTQVARALGLQDRFAEGHSTLDRVLAERRLLVDLDQASARDPELGTRIELERGRLFRSAGTDYVEITPEASYLQTLVSFFRRRGRRLRR